MPADRPTLPGLVTRFRADFLNIVGGSGDPELEDCPVSAEAVFMKAYPKLSDFKEALVTLRLRLMALDPSWLPGEAISEIMPGNQEYIRCEVRPWQLGFCQQHSLKGHSKLCVITELAVQFVEQAYDSVAYPIHICMPKGCPVGSNLEDWSLVHQVGFGKSCACRLVLLSALRLKLKDSELRLLKEQLQKLFSINAMYSASGSLSEQIDKALITKMQAAEQQRPDVLQIWHAFSKKVVAYGLQQLTQQKAAEFFQEFTNATLVESKRFSLAEQTSVLWLCKLSEAARSKISYHWSQFKVKESALTLKRVAELIEAQSTLAPKNHSNLLFKQIYTADDEKVQALLARGIGIFVAKLKLAVRSICLRQ